jgi:excisionase family DNA binding protein
VSDDRSRADRPLPERLALGEASRLLGVDPDTLRRWADEGRVPAFTTPGGHRRFERRALERLVAARRTGPATGLAGLGASPDRLSAAYRRRYGQQHGTGLDPRAHVPAAERASYRESGRRLVDALVRHLDETGTGRALAEREAIDLSATLGERLALSGVPMEDAVAMFVSARRPFLAELSIVARRRGVEASRVGQLYDTSTGLLDRLLLAFVAAHGAASAAAGVGAPGPIEATVTLAGDERGRGRGTD